MRAGCGRPRDTADAMIPEARISGAARRGMLYRPQDIRLQSSQTGHQDAHPDPVEHRQNLRVISHYGNSAIHLR